jgi:hypothetical protein
VKYLLTFSNNYATIPQAWAVARIIRRLPVMFPATGITINILGGQHKTSTFNSLNVLADHNHGGFPGYPAEYGHAIFSLG